MSNESTCIEIQNFLKRITQEYDSFQSISNSQRKVDSSKNNQILNLVINKYKEKIMETTWTKFYLDVYKLTFNAIFVELDVLNDFLETQELNHDDLHIILQVFNVLL